MHFISSKTHSWFLKFLSQLGIFNLMKNIYHKKKKKKKKNQLRLHTFFKTKSTVRMPCHCLCSLWTWRHSRAVRRSDAKRAWGLGGGRFPYAQTRYGNVNLTLEVSWIVDSIQFSAVAQSCPTLCNSRNRSTPGLPVHHELPEFTQTHVHRVHEAIQPSQPLLPPSLPALNPSQHQGLYQWVSSSHQVA